MIAKHGPDEVKTLIAVLQRPDASLHDKARACQQLGEFGTKEAVPALAALLNDEQLAAYARSGLEGIPDQSAAEALRSALTTLKGKLLAGAVNSLGVLRDGRSVAALSRLAANPKSGVAKEALLALGRISSPESIRFLRWALAGGSQALRADAAAACLLAAQMQSADGNPQNAAALYDAVRAANVSMTYRVGAVHNAIVARKSDGIGLLVESLGSDEREIRNAALLAVREMPTGKLAGALNAQLEKSNPGLQAQLVDAMADCHNTASLRAIRARAASTNSEIRLAALRTLGKIGDHTDAGVLVESLGGNPAEVAVAAAALARIQGPEVDAVVLKTLISTRDTNLRIALINVLDARSPAGAMGELLRQAADPDPRVAAAALRALRSLVGPEEVPALISLTKKCREGSLRAAAEETLNYACSRLSDPAAAGGIVLSELKQAGDDLDRASWIKALAAAGYTVALPTIAASLRAPNAWLVGVAIDNLGKWRNPAPIEDLLAFTETASNPAQRGRALNAAIQLAATAGAGRQASDSSVAAWFRRAGRAARSDSEKRVVISGLARWQHEQSIRLLLRYLDDPDVKPAATMAILAAAEPVAKGPGYAMLKPVLDRIASDAKERPITDRVAVLRRTMAATEASLAKQ